MNTTQQLQSDLDYVAAAVRRREPDPGVPAIYALWAVLVLIGFALPDFAPRMAGAYWFIAGIGGGLLSWWMGARDSRRQGLHDRELGKRYGLHWGIAGLAYFLTGLPMLVQGPTDASAAAFLLTTAIVYALAGVHLIRPLLWCGLLAFAGYVVLLVFAPPYAWTTTGVLMSACLAWAGWLAARGRAAGSAQ